METQRTGLGSEKMNKCIYWEVKHFQTNRIFRALQTKFWRSPATWASLKTRSFWRRLKSSKLYAKRDMIAVKLVVFNYKTQTAQNAQGFSCNYLLKGPSKKSFASGPLPGGALQEAGISVRNGIPRRDSSASVVNSSCCTALSIVHSLTTYRQSFVSYLFSGATSETTAWVFLSRIIMYVSDTCFKVV